MIQELLLTGELRAKGIEELKSLTLLTEAEILSQIKEEREAGAAILETLEDPSRFYLAESTRDLYKYFFAITDRRKPFVFSEEKRIELIDFIKNVLTNRRKEEFKPMNERNLNPEQKRLTALHLESERQRADAHRAAQEEIRKPEKPKRATRKSKKVEELSPEVQKRLAAIYGAKDKIIFRTGGQITAY